MNDSPVHIELPPLISVIVRCYNRADRICNAIDSVIAQSIQDFELIVVDDASDDDSVAVVAQHYGNNEQVRVVRHRQNRGAAAAANTGVSESVGRFVAFLDSDDTWMPQFLAAHLQALTSERGKLLSYCDYVQVFEDHHLERNARCARSEDQRRDMLCGGFIHSQSMTMMSREAVLAFSGFDEQYVVSHDFDLWLRMALAVEQPFVHIARPLVRYAMAADGVTTRHERWLQEYRAVVDKGFAHPAAKSYVSLHSEAREKIALGILARRQLMHWIDNPLDQTISVIVRTANRRKLLERALRSVRAQSSPPTQIVIVDNASTDDTLQFVEQLKDPGITLVHLPEAVSFSAAMNAGVAAASSELIAFLDDDDEWMPEYLAQQLRANSVVLKSPVYSYCDYRLVTHNAPERVVEHPATGEHSDALRHALFHVLPHTLSAFVTRREWYLAAGGANERMHVLGDVVLQLRLLRLAIVPGQAAAFSNPPVRIAQPLIRWHRGPANDYRKRMLQQYVDQAEEAFEEFFNSAQGQPYAHLRDEVVASMAHRMKGAWHAHFGLG